MIYGTCGSCNKKRLFVSRRTYKLPFVGKVESKEKLCFWCYRGIERINKDLLKKNNGKRTSRTDK